MRWPPRPSRPRQDQHLRWGRGRTGRRSSPCGPSGRVTGPSRHASAGCCRIASTSMNGWIVSPITTPPPSMGMLVVMSSPCGRSHRASAASTARAGPVHPGSGHLTPQHLDLGAQDEQLGVLGRRALRQQHQPSQQLAEDQVEQSKRDPPIIWASEAGAGLLTLDCVQTPLLTLRAGVWGLLEADRRCLASERSVGVCGLLRCEQGVPETALVLGREPGVGNGCGVASSPQREQLRPRPQRGNQLRPGRPLYRAGCTGADKVPPPSDHVVGQAPLGGVEGRGDRDAVVEAGPHVGEFGGVARPPHIPRYRR